MAASPSCYITQIKMAPGELTSLLAPQGVYLQQLLTSQYTHVPFTSPAGPRSAFLPVNDQLEKGLEVDS